MCRVTQSHNKTTLTIQFISCEDPLKSSLHRVPCTRWKDADYCILLVCDVFLYPVLLPEMVCNLLSCPLHLCSKRGFDVRSFGTGSHVKLPGPAPDKPNVYDFKTTYVQMYNDLVRKDKELYPRLTHFYTCAYTVYWKPDK